MARPRTGETPIQHARVNQIDWDDFAYSTGGDPSGVIRDFIRWHIRRKGAKLPPRPDLDAWREQSITPAWDEDTMTTAVAWFTDDLGHQIDGEHPDTDDFGRPEWQCERCGTRLNLTAKGRHVSSSGNARCPHAI